MLNANTLNIASRLADIVHDRGLYLQAEPGTLLDTLVTASRPVTAINHYRCGENPVCSDPTPDGPQGAQMTVTEVLTHTSREREPNGEYRHGRYLEEALLLAANSVRADHDFARNGVNPVVRSIVEAVETAEAQRSGEGDLRPNVVPYFYADIWDSASFLAVVDRYADKAIVKNYVPTPIVPPTDVTMTELVCAGVPALKEQVEQLLENRGEDFVAKVYRAVFMNDTGLRWQLELQGNSFDDGWFFSNSRVATDAVIVAHLLARAMTGREPPEGMDKSSYEAAVSSVVGSSGHRLQRALQQRALDKKNRQLVLAYGYSQDGEAPVISSGGRGFTSPTTGHIIVNGDLYNEFLEAGGTPEALMGGAYADQPTNADDLLRRNDELIKAYKSRETTLREQLSATRYSRVLDQIRVEVFRYLRTLDERELIRSREEYVQEIRKELSLMRNSDLDALWGFVRGLVCRVFFPHTNALRCLTKLDEVATRMPDVDVQVASFHATVEMMVDWLFEQILIKKA